MGALKAMAHQCSNCGRFMAPNEPRTCSVCVVALADLEDEVPVVVKSIGVRPRAGGAGQP